MSADEAQELIDEARRELYCRLENDEETVYICEEFFGLEPDYIFEIL